MNTEVTLEEARKWLNDIGYATEDDRTSRLLAAQCMMFAEDVMKRRLKGFRSTEDKLPRPYGDGEHFNCVPGGHVIVEGPGQVFVFCNSEEEAKDIWEQLSNAYAHGFLIGENGSPESVDTESVISHAPISEVPIDKDPQKNSLYWAYNCPLQYWPANNDDGEYRPSHILNYMPRKHRCEEIELHLLDEQTHEEFFNTAADKLENLAKLMRRAAKDPSFTVYYHDADPEV